MKERQIIADRLNQMEEERELLRQKSDNLTPYFWGFMLIAIVSILSLGIHFGFIGIPLVLTLLTRYSLIGVPFKELVNDVKSALLQSFMTSYHPDIDYRYFPEKRDVRDIVNRTRLVSANRYNEEDVIEGYMNDIEFYLSEIHLKRKSKNSSYTVFKGLLFKLKIPGKTFPKSRIQSKPGLLKRLFSGFVENTQYGFWYESNDVDCFYEEMEQLFPFISHLIAHQKDVRIQIEGDELTLLMGSDMKFLDDPKPSLKETFIKDEYFENIGKQLNSLLFIVESLANDLDKLEIEERLELKALEYVKRADLPPQDLDF